MLKGIYTMRNKFIKIILNNKNEFRTNMKISIPSINIRELEDVDVKIDTGCPYTSIPVRKLGISPEEAQKIKLREAGDETIIKEISFGVNDDAEKRKNDRKLFREKKYEQLKSVTFRHADVKLSIAGIDINTKEIKLSYDRTGNILIGMDILKGWDIHIGTIETGETIMLACPKDNMNQEYLSERNKLFGISNSLE